MAAVTTPWFVLRNIYLVLIVMFLAALLIQAYFAGRFILAGESSELHAMLGWPLAHGVAQLIMLVSFFTKGGKRLWITSILWGVTATVLPILAVLNEEGTSAAEAFHPMVAMVLLGMTVYLTLRAAQIVAEGRTAPSEYVHSMATGEPVQ